MGQTFRVDGYDLYYETMGQPDKPALLLVHGYTMSAHLWHTSIAALSADFYCVALDLLGHGRSPVDAQGDHTIEAQGWRVMALAAHLGITRFHLMGHSMGGQIALYIASRLAPDQILSLIVVDGVVSGKIAEPWRKAAVAPLKMVRGTPLVPLIAYIYHYTVPRFKWAARQQLGVLWHDFEARDFDWWRVDREHINRPGIHKTWFPAMDACLNTEITPFVPHIHCPALVIYGANDAVIPASEGEVLARLLPDCQLEIIPECGHLPMYETTDRYVALLRAFLPG